MADTARVVDTERIEEGVYWAVFGFLTDHRNFPGGDIDFRSSYNKWARIVARRYATVATQGALDNYEYEAACQIAYAVTDGEELDPETSVDGVLMLLYDSFDLSTDSVASAYEDAADEMGAEGKMILNGAPGIAETLEIVANAAAIAFVGDYGRKLAELTRQAAQAADSDVVRRCTERYAAGADGGDLPEWEAAREAALRTIRAGAFDGEKIVAAAVKASKQ